MKKIVLKIIGIFCIVIIALIAFIIIYWKAVNYNPLEDIQNESENISAYALYDNLMTYNGVEYNLHEILDFDPYDHIDEVFVIKEENVYFVYTEKEKPRNWIIASVNLETEKFEKHCVFYDPQEAYLAEPGERYEERNGFYLNGQIVLSDGFNVLVYDIESDEQMEYAYEEYDFPERKIYGHGIQGGTVISVNEKTKVWTLEDIAENGSDVVRKIYELRNKARWSKNTLYVDTFGEDSWVQCIDGRPYLIGQCKNYQASAVAVVLEYDMERNEWLYVASECTFETELNPHELYLIPVC